MYQVFVYLGIFAALFCAPADALSSNNFQKKAARAGERIADGAEELGEDLGQAWEQSAPQRRAIARGIMTPGWSEKDKGTGDRMKSRMGVNGVGTEEYENRDIENAARTGRNVAIVAGAAAVVVNAVLGIARHLTRQPEPQVVVVQTAKTDDESKNDS